MPKNSTLKEFWSLFFVTMFANLVWADFNVWKLIYPIHFFFHTVDGLLFALPITLMNGVTLINMALNLMEHGNVVHHRTPRIQIMFRMWLVGMVVCAPVIWVFAGEIQDREIWIWGLVSGFVWPYAVMQFVSTVVLRRGLNAILEGGNPYYETKLASGGDPFFDDLPPGFNTDSLSVRYTGLPAPKQFTCWNCHNVVQEMKYGDMEREGLICPYCRATMCACPKTRQLTCHNCQRVVAEAHPGDFERGVVCPYCGVQMFSTPQQ